MPGLSIVVPVYRSAEILPELVRRLEDVMPTLASSYEVVLVNDCSPDRSWKVIRELASPRSWIRSINLMRNYGQHNALLCGIRACRYGVIVTIDDDLQHPPEEIPKLLAVLSQNYDVVEGEKVRILRFTARAAGKPNIFPRRRAAISSACVHGRQSDWCPRSAIEACCR